ncbi:MAG: polysaccharide export protein [Candidatus Eremiobacteraeota bacterium]|nr:polysaccharide export protein [Candidatus Eremiobacteraeota bacterium]MBV9973060.1 polysaccharide export protein [Candidatus Eremiobacteraeota bacterium]
MTAFLKHSVLWLSFIVGVAAVACGGAVAAASDQYLIHRGDQLSVQVYGDDDFKQLTPPTVLPDGTITLPLIGRIKVENETTEAAAHQIAKQLQRYIRHPAVTVGIATAGQANVLVMGDVKTPGKYALRAGGRLTDAIAAAGGLAPTNGAFPYARVSLADGSLSRVSLQQLLHDGDQSQNVALDEGSVVYVEGPLSFDIEVVGAVDRPGYIQMREGDRLATAIAKAGTSSNSFADLNHIFVTRTETDGHSASHEVNLYQALQNGDMRYNPTLKKGDIVYVPQSRRPGTGASGILYLLQRWLIP